MAVLSPAARGQEMGANSVVRKDLLSISQFTYTT